MPHNSTTCLTHRHLSHHPSRDGSDSSCLLRSHFPKPQRHKSSVHALNQTKWPPAPSFTHTLTRPRPLFLNTTLVSWRDLSSMSGRRNNPRLNIPIPAREDPFVRPALHRLPLPPAKDVEDLSDLERLEILGHGSGGNVYKVRHRKTSAVYALKVIHGNHDQTVRRQIIREMEILKTTDSRHVVKCHGIFEKGEEIHFVLEYMEGGSLLDVVKQRQRRVSEAFLAGVARHVLEGLMYLHRQKIVHRDIKPSNLLVNRKQEVKIADFGVSRILSQTMDPCNTYVGTCAYMSPERFDPDSYGGRYDGYAGDIWSLGLSLLECFTGYFPFLAPGQKADWPTLMCAICYGEPPSPPASASADFQSFVRCCLHKDARKRWSAVQLLQHPFVLKPRSNGESNDNLSASLQKLAI